MRSPSRARGSLGRRTVALLALSLTVCAWLPAAAPAAPSERPPLMLGSPFGEHDGLTLLDDTAGTSVFAWRTTTGEGQAIDFAEIPPGGDEASSVQTVIASASHRLSTPVLAISPAGRVAVAWLEQRETEQEWSEDVLAVKVRERTPDGTWEAIRTLWRAPAKPVYGSRNLVVALDDSGDAAVLWTIEREFAANPQPSQLLVATRAAGGTYGEPVTLDREAAEALPALAVTPSGEVTALWARPWRTSAASLDAVSWRAGSSPGPGRISLDQVGPSESHGGGEPFGSLSLQTAGSGRELAVWSKGAPGSRTRPESVSVRAAWKPPAGVFEAANTVTAPGVEALEPALTLSNGGRALVAWSEIAADGSGPLLNYATATEGGSLTVGGPGAATVELEGALSGERRVSPAWLPGGKLLLAWNTGNVEYAEEIAPGTPSGAGAVIRRDRGESESSPLLVGGEAAPPVLAWAGRSPTDFSASGLRYVIGANLPAFTGSPSTSASLVGKRDLARAGVTVNIVCPEACVATITGAAYALRQEDPESAAAAAYARLGPFTTAHASLPSAGGKMLRLRLTRRTRKRFCATARRGDLEAVELTATIRTSAGQRHVVLGEEPTSTGCAR
jgi:hypothetical protein